MSDSSDLEDSDTLTEEEKFGKDGIIFMIDASSPMFIENESGVCAFRKCLMACEDAMRHKVMFSSEDIIAVVFFGTDSTNNDSNLSHISVMRGLERPSGPSVKQLREMHESSNFNGFREKYGHSEDYLLGDVLWLAKSMFGKNIIRLASSRILLLTCSPHPGKGDRHSEHQASSHARDLQGSSISLELVPCIPDYHPSDFLVKIMKYVTGCNESWSLPKSHTIYSLDDIPKVAEVIAGSKGRRSKCLGHMNFLIGEEVNIGIDVYNLVRSGSGPRKEKLYRSTNEIVKSSVVHSVVKIEARSDAMEDDSGCSDSLVASGDGLGDIQEPSAKMLKVSEEDKKPLLRYEMEKSTVLGGKEIRFTQDELKAMKRMFSPGMVLLGFVPVSFLRLAHHCNPSSFIYPGKLSDSGSKDLFAALWLRMGMKNVAALCSYTQRAGMLTRFVALVPSGLNNDNFEAYLKRGIRTFPEPQGFHLFFFPFADNINGLDLPARSHASEMQVEHAVAVLKRIRFIFHPSLIPNPAVETLWAAIEAIALDRPAVREVVDEIRPHYGQMDERLGDLAFQFVDSVYPSDYDPTAKKTSSGRTTASVAFSEVHMDAIEAAVKSGKVETFTVEYLKGYLRAKGKSVSGKKKADLVNEVYAMNQS